jgi:uncharacterized sulfatase
MKSKRIFALFAALLLPAVSAPAQYGSLASIFTNAPHYAAMPQHRPSIIFIAFHGLGLGDLSCYGQTNFQTPNIDRLATEGTRFTNYRVTSDDLAQEQAAFITGKAGAISPNELTVASRLQHAGYHTGLIGEWMLGSEPWKQGFDEFDGYFTQKDAKNYYSDFIWHYIPRSLYAVTGETPHDSVVREEIHNNVGGRKGWFMPDVLITGIPNFARHAKPNPANRYRPFFLLVNLPAPESVTPGKDDYPVPTDAPFSGENWPQSAKNRAAFMTRLDSDVGRMMEQLTTDGITTNNVVIFLAGAVAPEPFADTNMNFLKLQGEVRGGNSPDRLRVPMIARWPDHVPAGRVSPAPWSSVDFAPTALEIAHAEPAATFTGRSVLPVMLGNSGTNAPDMPDHVQRP